MKISIDLKPYLYCTLNQGSNLPKYALKLLGQGSGPQEFMFNLVKTFKSLKVKITPNILESNVHLINYGNYNTLWRYCQLKTPEKTFLRLDGIGIDSEVKQEDHHNIILTRFLERGYRLIFQSKFCEEVFKSQFKINNSSIVIHNGASSINKEKKIQFSFPDFHELPNKYYVVAGRSAQRKRIGQVIEIFAKYNPGNLVVLSNYDNKYSGYKNIFQLGLIHPLNARLVICQSQALIHLDAYDWCPNLVVQATHDGVPVICSNFGGTQELVSSNSIIIPEFQKLESNLNSLKYAISQKIPSSLLLEALKTVTSNAHRPTRISATMTECAVKYLDYFISGSGTLEPR